MPSTPRFPDSRGLIAALALALAAALAMAWLMPRGPVTTAQAIGSIVAGLVLGVAAGYLSGSRWSAVLAPLAFVAGYEVMRVGLLGVRGPTVESIQPGSMYGLIAFVVGRGVSALLLLVPIAVGVLPGVDLAARTGRRARPLGWTGRLVAGLGTVGLVALGILVAAPTSTAPITGPDGEPLEGSVAELASVHVGGHDQVLMIRGRHTDGPVLLYLAGGPGGTDLGAVRGDVGLEQDFVVVTWEQRGAGKSYAALDPADTLTLDQMVADTLEVTDYLRDRFDEDRIYLAGNSWGTILGVLAVQQAPDRYAAYVGTGQMVSPAGTDRMFWEDTLAWAEASGDDALAAKLHEIGPPPYADLLNYEAAISHEHDWNPYPELDLDREMPAILFVPENSFMDRVNGLRAFLDTFSVLYPQLQDLDFRRDAATLDVPVYMAIGAHEARGRAVLANEWFDALVAPSKERVVFAHSGHRPMFEEPGEFCELMRRVLAETSSTGT
jgi:proline iminopeptidase